MPHEIIWQTIKKVAHLNEQVLILLDNDEVVCLYPRKDPYEDWRLQEMDVHNVKDLKYELKYELGLITEEERDRLEEEREKEAAIASRQFALDIIKIKIKNNWFTAEEIFNN